MSTPAHTRPRPSPVGLLGVATELMEGLMSHRPPPPPPADTPVLVQAAAADVQRGAGGLDKPELSALRNSWVQR